MRGRLLLFLGALVTVLASLFYVRGRLLLVELSYQMAQKQAERRKLEERGRALTLELTTLKNPNRIEKIARDKLGLDRPQTAIKLVSVSPERQR